jgi:hypothetical protein
MSVERQSEDQDWADNPRLNAWLAEQEAAFPAWAGETGQQWDFTPESLDRLEDLLRDRFSTWDEVKAAEADPIVSVPAWYLGEVQNRHHGTAWYCNPQPPSDLLAEDGTPVVLVPEKPHDEDEDEEADDDYRVGSNPTAEIRALFVRRPENRLRDVLIRYR